MPPGGDGGTARNQRQSGADLRSACEDILWMPVPRGERNRRFRNRQTGGLPLEFGHSGRAPLSEKTLVWSGGGGPDHGLVGGWCVCGGKGHRVVGQLLA